MDEELAQFLIAVRAIKIKMELSVIKNAKVDTKVLVLYVGKSAHLDFQI